MVSRKRRKSPSKLFWGGIKSTWANMLEPPWRHSSQDDDQSARWLIWLMNWSWVVAGLVFGAFVAPSVIQFAGLSNSPYQAWLVIAVTVLAGFLVQFLGSCLVVLYAVVALESYMADFYIAESVDIVIGVVVFAFPYVGVLYALYLYFTSASTDQELVTTGFAGGILIKTFAIPFIKGIVTGTLLKWVIKALGGGKDTKKAD
jgi:hypothetical protein